MNMHKRMGLMQKPGGFNLLIERDADNDVLILMAKGTEDWENLRDQCDLALKRIEEPEDHAE